MWKTVLRRILILIPQLIGISVFIFFLAKQMPGDALMGLIGPDIHPLEIEAMRERMGINDPWPVQYVRWMSGIVRGDFGQSTAHHRAVTEVIGDRIGITFTLSLMTMLLTYTIAIPLGIIAGRYSGKIIDRAILIYTFTAMAFPTVVLAILMLYWFSPIGTGWFPLTGTVDPFIFAYGTQFEIFRSRLYHLSLPAITGALVSVVGIIFMLRANIIDRKSSDYVTFARSKGVPSRTIFGKHILRNSLIPIASNIGLVIAGLFSGSFFIERVFGVQGMGMLFLNSIERRDYPVVNAMIMMFAFFTAMGILLSDIILSIVDPRIRIK